MQSHRIDTALDANYDFATQVRGPGPPCARRTGPLSRPVKAGLPVTGQPAPQMVHACGPTARSLAIRGLPARGPPALSAP